MECMQVSPRVREYVQIIHLVVEYMQTTLQGHGVHAGWSKGYRLYAGHQSGFGISLSGRH
jgi:hypothetical protein